MESELEEAQSIATAANHKFEDAQRKCKVVEGDLERIIERAEEFEGKARDLETQVREMEGKVKETEAITVKVLCPRVTWGEGDIEVRVKKKED